MILYQFSMERRYDPLLIKGNIISSKLEVVKSFSEILCNYITANQISDFFVSTANCPPGKKSIVLIGDKIDINSVNMIINLAIIDDINIILRSQSCRFVMFGMDYIMYICSKHDDFVLKYNPKTICVDVSDRLIETDIFDN